MNIEIKIYLKMKEKTQYPEQYKIATWNGLWSWKGNKIPYGYRDILRNIKIINSWLHQPDFSSVL